MVRPLATPSAPEQAPQPRLGLLWGASPPMRGVFEKIVRVAPTRALVLLTGDSGTGKDLAAQTIHRLSRRVDEPFLPLSCGALSPALIESELFGHERGGFPSASRLHKGHFERADTGTLLLDEITEMPFELQSKLLRVLETGTLLRIGGDKPVKVNTRVIATTFQTPKAAVERGDLRQDLLYRLSVFPIHMPPLRERGEDITLLAELFLDRLNESFEGDRRLTPEALAILQGHEWPGNVRELENVIHRAFILADGEAIDARCLPEEIGGRAHSGRSLHFRLGSSIADVERKLILASLDYFDGNKRKTADVLGVSLKTLYNRLNAYRNEDQQSGND
ncbi:MAG: sigma-54 dependent transcriptional regulator [Acidobacteriota bacterium]